MRITVTLNPNVAAKAKRTAARLNMPFKDVINEGLRIGLDQMLKLKPAPYRTRPRPMGLRPGLSYDNVAELIALAEGGISR